MTRCKPNSPLTKRNMRVNRLTSLTVVAAYYGTVSSDVHAQVLGARQHKAAARVSSANGSQGSDHDGAGFAVKANEGEGARRRRLTGTSSPLPTSLGTSVTSINYGNHGYTGTVRVRPAATATVTAATAATATDAVIVTGTTSMHPCFITWHCSRDRSCIIARRFKATFSSYQYNHPADSH